MYTFIREVAFKTLADAARAVPVTMAITRYYKDALKVDLRLMRPVCGSPLRLRFISEMESMDANRALQLKAMQDPAFQQLLGEIAPFVDGSRTHDEIWQ